jgi:ubiquinone/menaquinone biosynthesis C-methylase UbiE
MLRAMWDGRTGSWHEHVNTSPHFERIRDEAVAAARLTPTDRVVDLGAGTGFLALAVATDVDRVVAVDLSERMLDVLADRARDLELDNVTTMASDLTTVALESASVDVVMSSYALHHLRDADKVELVARARTWLAPGGRVVIADMMFGRGRSAEDRRIIRQKITALLKKGPGGVWRVAKNLVRFGVRRGSELPASPDFWVRALERAGFVDVRYRSIVAEAGLVTARVPPV